MKPKEADLIGDAKTFGLWHPVSMIEKLRWERDLVVALVNDGNETRSFALLNAFATAWHLVEWSWGVIGPKTRQKLGLGSMKSYREDVLARFPDLHLARQIGVGGKHRHVTIDNDPTVITQRRVVLGMRRTGPSEFRQHSWSVRYVVYFGETERDVLELIDAMIAFWTAEMERLRQVAQSDGVN